MSQLPRPSTDVGDLVAGKYRLLRRLGQGGMEIVFEAEQAPLGRRVALKVLRAASEDDASLAAERFAREAQTAAQINHPNVVTIHDYGVDEVGQAYLVMELVRGVTLRERLQEEGRLAWPEALAAARDVARALRAAHALGVVHRDLKPENVMWVRDGHDARAMVLDFGLAKLRADAQAAGPATATLDAGQRTVSALTRDGTFLGTPGYVAPEFALRGIGDDPRSDLYALGVMLFELVAGEAPFTGPTPLAVVLAHLQQTPPRVAEVAPAATCPPALEDLIARLLAKDPGERPASAAALLAEIDALAPSDARLPSPALAPSIATETALPRVDAPLQAATPPVETAGSAQPTPATSDFPTPLLLRRQGTPMAPRQHLRAGLAGAGALGLAIAIAGGVFWSWRTASAADLCARGEGAACLAHARTLEGALPLDGPSAFSAYQRACDLGETDACTRLTQPWPGGRLRHGFLGERGRFDPYERADTVGRRVARHITERLVTEDDEGRLALAALAVVRHEAGEASATLSLRPGLRFPPHTRCFPEGRAANARDLARSLEEATRRTPRFQLPIRGRRAFLSGASEALEGVSVEGDKVVLALEQGVADIRIALSHVWLQPAIDEACDSLRDMAHPVGTGPYRLEDASPSGQTTLRAVAEHPDAGHIDAIEYIPVGDAAEALARIRADRLDLLVLPAREAEEVLEREAPLRLRGAPSGVRTGEVVLSGMLELTLLQLNARRVPAFRDRRVRQGLSQILAQAVAGETDAADAARGRFLPAWAQGFDAGGPSTPPGDPGADAVARAPLPSSGWTLGYAIHQEPVARWVLERLRHAGYVVNGQPVAVGVGARAVELFDLSLETLRPLNRGRDAASFLAFLVPTLRHYGHPLPGIDVLTELIPSTVGVESRARLAADLEQQLREELPAIPLRFGPRARREKVALVGGRVEGYLDDATARIIGDDQSLWLRPVIQGSREAGATLR